MHGKHMLSHITPALLRGMGDHAKCYCLDRMQSIYQYLYTHECISYKEIVHLWKKIKCCLCKDSKGGKGQIDCQTERNFER